LLDVVYGYSVEWKFRFNSGKCKIMRFGVRIGLDHPLFLGSEKLEFGQMVKYLGVDLMKSLSWKEFHRNLILRARKRMCLVTGAIVKGLSVEASIRVWNYLVRSVL
jgi:hypothetical protein